MRLGYRVVDVILVVVIAVDLRETLDRDRKHLSAEVLGSMGRRGRPGDGATFDDEQASKIENRKLRRTNFAIQDA